MATFNYKVMYKSTAPRNISLEFTPYKNLISDLNTNTKDWEVTGNKVAIHPAFTHRIAPGSPGSLFFESSDTNFSIKRTITGLPADTPLLVSIFVRNNSVKTTSLIANGTYLGSVVEKYVNRLGGVVTTSASGELEMELNFMDSNHVQAAWVDGFFATEIAVEDVGLPIEKLWKKYPYTAGERKSPSQYDILDKMLHYLPYRYFMSYNGRRVPDYTTDLVDFGMDATGMFEVYESDVTAALNNACSHDIPLMAMLEGNPNNITHAFPKEGSTGTNNIDGHFPRVQYFSGFSVNSVIADAQPIANEFNWAINIYVPIHKVMESVDANMINNQMQAIMSSMGWSSVRGSDYFIKQEQLYVLQVQYIQQLMIAKRRI